MSTVNTTGELTIEELQQVRGAAIVEFRIGPAAFQFNSDGGYAFWNGRDLVGEHYTK